MPLPFSRLAIQNPQPFSRHMLPLSRLLIFWLWPLPSGHLSPPPPRKCHHLLFFSQWPCCIGCGKGLGPCLPPPLPLPSPAFVLALAPFTGAGPVGSSELSVVSFCSLLLLLLEELDSFSLGLDSFFLVPARSKKMMWEYLCSQDLISFLWQNLDSKNGKKHPVQKFWLHPTLAFWLWVPPLLLAWPGSQIWHVKLIQWC